MTSLRVFCALKDVLFFKEVLTVKFTKMQGLGNDYVYVYSKKEPNDPEKLSVKLSDRHFGIGSDGMIWILPSKIADFKMRIFNADGSEAMMCGNGIRCVGKYVYDKGLTDKDVITVETLSGIKKLKLKTERNKVKSVSVNMGRADAGLVNRIEIGGRDIEYIPVSVGNPHAVIFVDDIKKAEITAVGPAMEHCDRFPGGVNVEFVQVLSDNKLRMRVWERGSGITMACGTGSCATVMAAISVGLCRYNTDIAVELDGGTLMINISENNEVTMTGPAEISFEGEVNI